MSWVQIGDHLDQVRDRITALFPGARIDEIAALGGARELAEYLAPRHDLTRAEAAELIEDRVLRDLPARRGATSRAA